MLLRLRILILCLSFLPGLLHAADKILSDQAIYDYVDEVVREAVASLPEDADPYGFFVAVQASLGEDGLLELDRARLAKIVHQHILQGQRFKRFDLEQDPNMAPTKKGFYLRIGLAPTTAPEIENHVVAKKLTIKQSSNGRLQQVILHVKAEFFSDKARDGAIIGEVQYYDDGYRNWDPRKFPTKPFEKQLRVNYRRLGPGDNRTNSGEDKRDEWFRVGNTGRSRFQVTSRSPGHYFPSVRLRGCEIRYEDPEADKDREQIVKLDSRLDWANVNHVSASTVSDTLLQTDFSLKNTVKGRILDASGRPVRDGLERRVRLESKDWQFADRDEDESYLEVITRDEHFEFPEMVPSGVYFLYVKDKPKNTVVEVCNCDSPNQTYEQDLRDGQPLYIALETTYTRQDDLESMEIGSYGPSGPGSVELVAKTVQVYHLYDLEIVFKGGGKSIVSGITGHKAEGLSKVTRFDSRIPQFHEDHWETEVQNDSSETGCPDASFPSLVRAGDDEGQRHWQPGDRFRILPMFDDPADKAKADAALHEMAQGNSKAEGGGQQGDQLSSLLGSLARLAEQAAPLVEDLNKDLEGVLTTKQAADELSFADLVRVASGQGSLSRSDKIVRRKDKQVDKFMAKDKKTVDGFAELARMFGGKNSEQGDFFQKASKFSDGGMTNSRIFDTEHDRPATITITRQMKLRRATPEEIRDAQVPESEDYAKELTDVPFIQVEEVRVIH